MPIEAAFYMLSKSDCVVDLHKSSRSLALASMMLALFPPSFFNFSIELCLFVMATDKQRPQIVATVHKGNSVIDFERLCVAAN